MCPTALSRASPACSPRSSVAAVPSSLGFLPCQKVCSCLQALIKARLTQSMGIIMDRTQVKMVQDTAWSHRKKDRRAQFGSHDYFFLFNY